MNLYNATRNALLMTFLISALPGAFAQGNDARSQKASGLMQASETTEAEVRKVDKDNKKITLKHGAIKHLDMPAMTMVFGVKDAAMLNNVQAGDKVQFKATHEAGKFTVTEIRPIQ